MPFCLKSIGINNIQKIEINEKDSIECVNHLKLYKFFFQELNNGRSLTQKAYCDLFEAMDWILLNCPTANEALYSNYIKILCDSLNSLNEKKLDTEDLYYKIRYVFETWSNNYLNDQNNIKEKNKYFMILLNKKDLDELQEYTINLIQNRNKYSVALDSNDLIQLLNKYFPVTIQEEELANENEIYTHVEEPPYYPGGDMARVQFLKDNIKYPDKARLKHIQGTVWLTFTIELDGSISNIRVIHGIGGGCEEETIRVLKIMPKWHPGKQDGRPVRVKYNMPIKFTLTDP